MRNTEKGALHRFTSFEKAINSLNGAMPEQPYTILSFDVFDTLVFRRCHPQAVVEGVARWLTQECRRLGIPMRSDAATCRERAYRQLTAAKIAEGLDPDCTLTELCHIWVEEIAAGHQASLGDLAMRLEAYEVELEKTVCFANTPFLELLRGLKAKGFRLIYVSDMYLGHHVCEILDACGFAGIFDRGYVSGDIARLKRTGALFTYVLKSEGVPASQMLHVGDNPINDGARAVELAISAYVIRDKQELRRYHGLEFDWRYVKRDPSYAGFVAAAFSTAGVGDYGSFEESLGIRLFGPVFAAFLHGVVSRCAQEELRNIFFVAREGSILKDLFLELAPLAYRNCCLPKANYIGVSRHTALLYAMNDLGMREMSKISLNTDRHSLRKVLAPLRVPEATIMAAAAQCGIKDIDATLPAYYRDWGPFHQVVAHPAIRSHIDNLTARSKKLIDKYLEQRGLFHHPRAAVIDVGWNAQIQENLYFGSLNRADRPQFFGFYLGTMLRAHWSKSAHNVVEGMLVDESELPWHGHAAFEFIPILEACVRAPHGTVVDHAELPDGEVIPVFKQDSEKSRQAEMLDEVTIARLQTGVRTYVANYGKAVELFGFDSAQMAPYAQMIVDRLVRFPTRDEAQVFLPMNNVWDLGSDHVAALSSGLVGTPVWKAWLKMRAVVSQCGWRYGALVVLGLRFLQPLYAIAFRLRPMPGYDSPATSTYVAPDPTPAGEYRIHVWKGKEAVAPAVPQAYEPGIKIREQTLAELGRSTAKPVALQGLTLPLTFREALRLWLTSRAAGVAWRASKRQPLTMDGMRIRPLLYRAIYSRYPTLIREIARRAVSDLEPSPASNSIDRAYAGEAAASQESLQSV